MLQRPLSGVISAPYLPMKPDGEIDWPGLERYMDWLAIQNPAGIAMNMDASEVIALSEDEQEQVIRVCIDVLKGRVPFLSGIVAGSTRSAAAKAERYAKLGVEGFPVFPPFPTFSGAPVPSETSDMPEPHTQANVQTIPRSDEVHHHHDNAPRLRS